MSQPEERKARAERELREQVAALGQKFLQRTQAQALSLREQLRQLCAHDFGVLLQMQEMTHKIHGSGAMFGFAKLSECAGDMERSCIELTGLGSQAAGVVVEEQLQRLTDALDQLEQSVRDILQSPRDQR